MLIVQWFFEAIFLITQILIACFSLHYIYLACRSILLKEKQVPMADVSEQRWEPFVTFQVPIYNEKHVVKRFIQNIAQLDYPTNKFEVQLLDDSTDETRLIIENEIKKYPSINFIHLTRNNRLNYKAGALNNGLLSAKGSFIAIFDIDFIPPKDFLSKILLKFHGNDRLAFVQTRWGHSNRNESFMTKAISLGIDNHFVIEQPIRNKIGVLTFNGTCGVFRKEAIISAGNWDGSILSEDLDLSYRIHLEGWKSDYIQDIVCPGEIPNKISSYKFQQYRWSKGSSQSARKNFLTVIKSKQLTKQQKIESFFQHFGYFIQLAIFLNIVSIIPLIHDKSPIFLNPVGIDFFALNITASGLYLVTKMNLKMNFWSSIIYFSVFTAITIGISWKTSIGSIKGLFIKNGEFTRTPKGISSNTSSYLPKSTIDLIIELVLIMYLVYGIYISFTLAIFLPILYLGFCIISFGTVFVMDLQEQLNLSIETLRITQSIRRVFDL